MWRTIVSFCMKQVARRAGSRVSEYCFTTFSLIISSNVHEQCKHIDMKAPNVQGCVMLSPNCTGTYTFQPKHQYDLNRVDGLLCFWAVKAVQMGYPEEQLALLQKSLVQIGDIIKADTEPPTGEKGLVDLMAEFGEVLNDDFTRTDEYKDQKLPVGTTILIPGSLVHAGPEQKAFRVILFFAGTEKDNPKPYDTDEQYSKTSFLATIVDRVFFMGS